jgi:hypothetical protein
MVSQAYRTHFPIGVFVDGAGTGTVRVVDGHAATVNLNTATGVKTAINHPDSGCKATGLHYLGWTNQQPYNQEGGQALSATIEAQVRGGSVYQMCAPMDKPNVEADSGWNNGWFHLAYDAGFHTPELAATIAARYAPHYAGHPSVLAFNLRDDAAPDTRSVLAVRAISTG